MTLLSVICFLSRCLFLVVLWCALYLCGQSTHASSLDATQYISRAWQTDEGLPLNAIQTIEQTRDGYLWVGTSRGLARFDGVNFNVFASRNTPEFLDPAVTVVRQSHDGTMWVGTGRGLLYLRDGHFYYRKVGDSARGNYIKCLFESHDGSLWVGTLDGLFRLQNNQWTQFQTKDGLADDIVRSICESGDELWIGTRSGLSVWRNGRFKSIDLHVESSVLSALTVAKDSAGDIWVGLTDGLMHIGKNGTKLYTKKDGLPDNNVTAILQDHVGNLWIGTYGGLCRLVDGKFLIEKDHNGAFYDQVNQILEDSEGDVWVGARDGLHELRPRRFLTYTRQEGLAHNNVVSVLEDHNGNVWAGTWGGGVVRLKDGKFTIYNKENLEVSGLRSDMILSLFEDSDGSIFAGSDYGGGTFRYNQVTDKFERYWSPERSLKNRGIRVIYRDRKGNLWFGASPGLIQDNTGKRFLVNDEIQCMLEDHTGALWVGSNRGLYVETNGTFVHFVPDGAPVNRPVLALYEDKQQNMWVSFDNAGLYLYRNGNGVLFGTHQGLWSDEIFEILEDEHDWLWMSSSKGVFRVNKTNVIAQVESPLAQIECLSYGRADGLECIQCSGVSKPAAWRGHDGRLWFATSKGLAVTDPNAATDFNARPPGVDIQEVFVDKKPVEISPGSPIRVKQGRGELEIHYTALSFQAAEKNQFRYRLTGVDSEWVDAGARRVAYYNNLRPGSYSFQVLACNNDGIWSEKPAELAVALAPHFWQLPWFSVLIAIAAAGVIGGSARYVTRKKLERKLERLEHQNAIEKERTRIAQDMHDDLGARLTEILLLNELVRKNKDNPPYLENFLDKQLHVVRDVAEGLDSIVWAVNPVNDSLESLSNYLCEQVERLLSVSSIRCRFDVPGRLPAQFVSSEVRHNVFLTVRESLNNCLKHSGASEVWFRIRTSPAALSIVMEDDGRGITEMDRSTSGNGLHNMERRMKTLGGSFRISSRPGKGTQIHLEVPLKAMADEQSINQHNLD